MKPVGRKIIRLESVDSTNNYTANLIKASDVTHGSVILAVEQTAGRGQRNAEWLVKPGENLTFSLYIDEVKLSVSEQFKITQLVSLAICDLLKKYSIIAKIKWPNDIYVDSKKIAGVLIENQLQGESIKSSIIGIGLNVNQTLFEGFDATSLKLCTGNFVNIEEVLFGFIHSFNQLIDCTTNVEEEYLKRMYLINKKTLFLNPEGNTFRGEIIGVSPTGKLRVLVGEGMEEFDLKGIQFTPQNEI